MHQYEIQTVKYKIQIIKIKKPATSNLPNVTWSIRLYRRNSSKLTSLPIVENSQMTVKTAKMTTGVPIVTCLPRLYQPCTNSVSKTVKRQSKQQKITVAVPIVTCLLRVRRIYKVRVSVRVRVRRIHKAMLNHTVVDRMTSYHTSIPRRIITNDQKATDQRKLQLNTSYLHCLIQLLSKKT